METVTARVPEELFRDIKEIEKEEKAERAEVIRKLLDDAIRKLAESERIEIDDAEVLHLAKKHVTSLMTSDGWLVKVAKGAGVQAIWTTTFVLLAVKNGKISKSEGKNLLRELVLSGPYVRPDMYVLLLQTIDEL